MPNDEARSRTRSPADLIKLKRSPAQSHWHTQSDIYRRTAPPEKGPLPKLADYLRIQVGRWVFHYLKSRFGKRHAFNQYDYAAGHTGVYRLEGRSPRQPQPPAAEIRISLVADWGTGTAESQQVADALASFRPHYTIHLGDVYYVGTRQEVEENFFSLVDWPEGSVGSFALNGNHEMYAKGKAYFETLLPTLGLRDPATGAFQGQQASFFCLENDFWRILGLDTGYNSIRRIPLSEYIVPPSCKFPDPLLAWLRDPARLAADKRGLILLTHHPYFSAFERAYEKPGQQLAEFIRRPVLWFWGHEHRLALYGRYAHREGIEAYGRCMGHGGMPIEDFEQRPKAGYRKYKLVIYDARFNQLAGHTRVGFNGFVNLTFSGSQVHIDYRDINDHSLLTEAWAADPSTGELKALGIQLKQDLSVPKDLGLPDIKAAQA